MKAMHTAGIGRMARARPAVSLRTLGWMSLVLAAVTAGLITYGSWVRVSGSGLGCPDWPLCAGGVLPKESGAQAIEYGHRLLAGLTMLATWAMGYVFWRRRAEAPRAALFLIGASLLILVQAILGGVTVLTDLSGWVRLAHLGVSMSTLGLMTAGGLVVLAQGWEAPRARLPVLPLVLIGAAVIMAGGSIVATQNSFACTTLPLCTHPRDGTAEALHVLHRSLGLVLGAGIALGWLHAWRRGTNRPILLAQAVLTVALAAQMSMGAYSLTQHLPNHLRILHLGLATVTWWAVVALWVLATARYRDGRI
jgi:heme A synthase